jgi:thioredoxin-like negative regulator of GroEL
VDSLLLRVLVLGAVMLVALAVGVVLKQRSGRVRTVSDAGSLSASDVGQPLGAEATFVQFSTTTCTSCRTVRRVLGEHAAATPGVTHVEVDAEQRLDLARRFHVLRTPTVLVLDGAGRVTARFSGVPTPRQVRDAVPHVASGR